MNHRKIVASIVVVTACVVAWSEGAKPSAWMDFNCSDGLIDNVRFFASALSIEDIETVRAADVNNRKPLLDSKLDGANS